MRSIINNTTNVRQERVCVVQERKREAGAKQQKRAPRQWKRNPDATKNSVLVLVTIKYLVVGPDLHFAFALIEVKSRNIPSSSEAQGRGGGWKCGLHPFVRHVSHPSVIRVTHTSRLSS